MKETVLAILGIGSAVTNLAGIGPYLRDIFGHKTKPDRATWWIWLSLNVIAFFAQLAAGATWSLLMTGAQLLVVLTVAILSVTYGFGKFEVRHFLSLIVAMFGILLWKFTKNPLAALLIVVLVDAVGFSLTVAKTWKAPGSETLVTWVLGSVSGVLAVLAVGEWNFTKLIYPAYIMLGNTLLVWIIVTRRQIKKSA